VKRIISVILSFVLLIAVAPALAVPNFSNVNLNTPGAEKTLTLPTATSNSSVISLGSAIDPQTGKAVEGYAIIHPKKAFDHKPNHKPGPKDNGSNPTTSSCFTYLSNGAKWKSVEPWVVNTQNSRGLSNNVVFDTLKNGIAKWEDATDGDAANGIGANVIGSGSITTDTLVADTSSPDGKNEVYFADVSSNGAIAVTIVWGIFSGPPFARELVEWEQIYDDVDFDWSANGEAGKMDLDNIVTHELGHSFGLGDLYESTCLEETMFGYASEGETSKRDLNAGDITGIDQLY
jgi:hypothetical protein